MPLILKDTSTKTEQSKIPPSRIKATFRGVVLGWYDTPEEAQFVLDKAIADEEYDNA